MYRRTSDLFASTGFRKPAIWRRPSVLFASLAINLLALALPTVILQIYDRIIPNRALDTFSLLMIGMLGVIVLDTLLKIFRSIIMSWEGARFDHIESLRVMNRILDADPLEFDEKPAGYYLDRMQALEKVQEFYSGQSALLVLDFPFAVVFLALIWVITGPLILIPIGLLALFMIISVITGKNLHRALEERNRMEDRRQNFIIETLRGIHTIKSMAMEPFMLRRYERLQGQSASSVYELSRINSVVQGIGATFSQLAVVTFVAIGSLSVVAGDLSVGALAAGTMLSSRVLQPGLRAMGIWIQFQSIRLALDKVRGLHALKREESGDLRKKTGLKGEIELRRVNFRYPQQDAPLLRDITLHIRPGEAVGITGSNGSGKSTLIGLLSGFLHPDSGKVLLDGHDIREYDLEYLRSQIGIVPQQGILFEGTILENMTLYREGEAVDQAIELAGMLGLDRIIARLPDGLDTMIGGAAVDTLSEGVRQKIVMIRSLIGHPSIMLFDDANANFDITNDMRFLSVVRRFKGSRTLVVVSHRPSFLRLCDRCFLLADGLLREIGPADRMQRPVVPADDGQRMTGTLS
ncbi:MAG TPA: ATP-binding cassette domain-containing protein [Sedimenticola thiotaurini]|uniref:ATP-binding cassette domain-containing protein n=1 Tax=Sedimenticola thiotaurini TaxID=1543721 RepID=A0A831RQ30_9GAMM|nr:ATP-binding cassette domain-containing protein [Sedimenticola thiotaurini]